MKGLKYFGVRGINEGKTPSLNPKCVILVIHLMNAITTAMYCRNNHQLMENALPSLPRQKKNSFLETIYIMSRNKLMVENNCQVSKIPPIAAIITYRIYHITIIFAAENTILIHN